MNGTNAYPMGVEIQRTKYYIEEVRIARWCWGHRTEYVVVSDFVSFGGFKTRDEAHAGARACGFEWLGGL